MALFGATREGLEIVQTGTVFIRKVKRYAIMRSQGSFGYSSYPGITLRYPPEGDIKGLG